MTLTDILVILGGSTVLSTVLTVLGNGVFGWAKGRADAGNTEASTAEIFNKLAAESARRDADRADRDDRRIAKLVEALENLTDAVDRVVPMLERGAANDHELDDARKLRAVNSIARMAI